MHIFPFYLPIISTFWLKDKSENSLSYLLWRWRSGMWTQFCQSDIQRTHWYRRAKSEIRGTDVTSKKPKEECVSRMRKCSTIVNATRKCEDKGDKDVNIIIATTKQNKEREKEREARWYLNLISARYDIDEMLERGNSNYKEIYFTLSFAIKGVEKVGDNMGKLEI